MSQQRERPFTETIRRLPLLQDHVVKFVFDNLRNIGLSLLPLLAAKTYLKNPYKEPAALVNIVAWTMFALSLALLALNFLHAMRYLLDWQAARETSFPWWRLGGLAYVTIAAFLYVLLAGAQT